MPAWRNAAGQCRGLLVLGLLLQALPVWACELLVLEHRSAKPLRGLALDPGSPQFTLAFEHSVLGTTVTDTYRVRAERGLQRIWLVEERFRGEGYGLPHAPGPQEQLQRDAGSGAETWILTLNRLVEPLVIRPLRGPAMRLTVGNKTWLLADLLDSNNAALELIAQGCSNKE